MKWLFQTCIPHFEYRMHFAKTIWPAGTDGRTPITLSFMFSFGFPVSIKDRETKAKGEMRKSVCAAS